MKRKLFALLLCGVAILLLMSAGLDQPVLATQEMSSSIRTEEPSAPAEKPVDTIEEQGSDEQPEPPEEQAALSEPELDFCLLVDGQPVLKEEVSRTTIGDMTYVSLSAIAKEIDPAVVVSWDEESQTATVTSEKLKLTAVVGQLYLQANGRYLYLPEGVQLFNGKTMVSLDAVAKAFDAVNGWDEEAGTFTVTRGSGAITPGDQFYNETDLFWLSRLITAESGNQPLNGQIAVANVVLNRVNNSRYPDSVHGVLAQKNQFTTYRGGALANRTPYARSVIAAKLALDGAVVKEVEGALFFDGSSNSWAARNRPFLSTIGGHKFYG